MWYVNPPSSPLMVAESGGSPDSPLTLPKFRLCRAACARDHDDDARRCVPSLWSHQMRNNRNPNLRLRDPCRKRQGVRQGARFSVEGVPIQRLAPQPVKPRVSAGFLGGDHHLTAPQSTGTLPRVPDDNPGGANPPTAAHLPGARGSAPRMVPVAKNRRGTFRIRHRQTV